MLQLSKDAMELITRWASQHPAVEVVGMVWQHPDGYQSVQPLRNMHSRSDKYYSIDPRELAEAYARHEQDGAQVLAFYHSHPGGKPDPSEEDMEGALNVGVHYLIAYPKWIHKYDEDPEWRLSAWECIDMGILVEDGLEVAP